VGVASFLWVADSLPLAQAAVGVAALWAGMWALGAAMQARLSVVAVLGVDAVILAASYGGLLLLR
jgi:alkylglycerol monooxygenase